MNKGDRIGMIKTLKKRTLIFIYITALISFPTLGLWILGFPGMKNEYARGWSLGLKTLYHYLVGCGIILAIYVVIARGSQKFHVLERFNIIVLGIFWIFFSYSVFNIYRALQIMGIVP
ncbi:hypothetical protein ACSQ6I_20105 [Anabaena sp. WFMT]|uniref:hypothetical protein n=1 Tax=Anabaena sp. WFMT TaxID=3449730 RepID=UPI003F29AD10